MVPSEVFHKRASARFVVFALATIVTGCAEADAVPAEQWARAASGVGLDASAELPISPPAGYAWVIFGADTVVAEVARTADERAKGLMYREEVPDGTGMLFVFPDSQPRSFWMANTYIALDIAYMDPSFRVVDIIAMEPLITDSYPSRAPAMFGLEVRQGWFGEQDIAIGAQAEVVFGVQGR